MSGKNIMWKRSLEDHSEADGGIVLKDTTTPRIKHSRPPGSKNKVKVYKEGCRSIRLCDLNAKLPPRLPLRPLADPIAMLPLTSLHLSQRRTHWNLYVQVVAAVVLLCLWMI